MENVLSSLQFETESEQPTNKKDTKWNLIDLRNKYDSGALLAGMGDSEGSVQDFIIKLSNVFSTIAKSRQKVIDQKLLDLVKTSLLLYLDSLNIKKDNIKDNAEIISTIHGFVNQFVENGKYEDRL